MATIDPFAAIRRGNTERRAIAERLEAAVRVWADYPNEDAQESLRQAIEAVAARLGLTVVETTPEEKP